MTIPIKDFVELMAEGSSKNHFSLGQTLYAKILRSESIGVIHLKLKKTALFRPSTFNSRRPIKIVFSNRSY